MLDSFVLMVIDFSFNSAVSVSMEAVREFKLADI